jgi:hypothetical protein
MAHAAIIDFLHKFSALRSKVNNKPSNLVWMAGQSSDVEAAAIGAYLAWQTLNSFLATAPSKGIDRVPKGFKQEFQDHESKWSEWVGKVIGNTITRIIEDLAENPEQPDATEDQEPDRPDFNPVAENPAQLVEDILWLSDAYAQWDDDLADQQRKALQAWEWFENTAGLNLKAVARRWKLIPPMFIPDHVADAYGRSQPGSLYELLDEAVKAYVFGASGAAIAMCRALTGLILTKHYGCEGEDLERIIVFAEQQPKYHWMKKHKLQDKRKLANQVLHDYREVADEAVVNWLTMLKELIERVPDRSVHKR